MSSPVGEDRSSTRTTNLIYGSPLAYCGFDQELTQDGDNVKADADTSHGCAALENSSKVFLCYSGIPTPVSNTLAYAHYGFPVQVKIVINGHPSVCEQAFDSKLSRI